MNQLLEIRDRLRRAEEHIEAIKSQLRAYYDSQPYNAISGEFDPQTQNVHFDWGVPFDPPSFRLSTLTGEVLHNLRSALDHLAWELVEANQAGAASENTRFPILKVPPTANQSGVSPPPHVSGNVSATASTLIEREQPYQLGSAFAAHPLYILNALNNIDKHRHITIRGVRSDATFVRGPVPQFTFTGRLASASEWGAEVEYVPDDSTLDVNFRATFRVVVHEVGPGIVMPLLDALRDANERVGEIARQARRTCFLPPPIVL